MPPRKAVAANVAFVNIQQRDGRWVLVDLINKRNKVRSVPNAELDKAYASATSLTEGLLFGPINKGGRISGERLTKQAIYNMVIEYAKTLGLGDIAPHDLRRTYPSWHIKADPREIRFNFRWAMVPFKQQSAT
ncbi:MAG TPA: hypothetical protein VIV66_20275 [Pyrinomonadaceae bacterium]